jgi:hypothetical protein
MARAKQPVNIDGIEFDALIELTEDYEAEVPSYPTEKGFNVSDNVTLKPITLTMTVFLTDTPVTWAKRFGVNAGRMESVVKKLEQLYFDKKVVTVTMTDAVYENMVMTNLSIVKSSDTGYAREIPITMQEIIVVESKTVTIPSSYGKSGTTSASTGTASTTTSSSTSKSSSSTNSSSSSSSTSSSSTKKSSILYGVAKTVGLIS